MESLLGMTNVFGVVGALGLAATVALWRAWAKERQGRQKDWEKFEASLAAAHEQVIEHMELRLAAQEDMLAKYSKMQGKLNEAVIRIDAKL